MSTSTLELMRKPANGLGADNCDGCGYEFTVGDKMIVGIESCCGGGCSRCLCERCAGECSKLMTAAADGA